MDEGLAVHQFELGPWDNFIYLLGDRATRTCAVVDPAWDAPTILREAEKVGWAISAILCTHSHFDHVDQVGPLLETLDIPVHMLDAEVEFSGFRSENLVRSKAGDMVKVGTHVEVTLMHTPGHTPGSTSYRVRDGVVTGDTLFVDGCGRCDFVGGDPEVMYKTLHTMLERLPANTILYPGHDYGETPTATVEGQRATNPYLTHSTVEAFVAHRMEGKAAESTLPPRPEWSP